MYLLTTAASPENEYIDASVSCAIAVPERVLNTRTTQRARKKFSVLICDFLSMDIAETKKRPPAPERKTGLMDVVVGLKPQCL
jgi:hypothetical protein